MANGSSRFLWLAFAFVVGGVVGWLLRPAPTPPPPSGSSSILVGPAAKQLTIPRLVLSKSGHDVVWWNSRNPGRILWIEFDRPVFEGMVPGEAGRHRVRCEGASCFSGNILEGAAEGDYKYWQILSNPDGTGKDSEDGWIIIQK